MHAQVKILNNPILTHEIKQGLDYTYNYNFNKAASIYNHIEKILGKHPAVEILNAINLYWENYPLIVGSNSANTYFKLLNEASKMAISVLKNNPEEPEALLYNMIAKGMIMMVYADNDEVTKVLPEAKSVYNAVLKSFEIQEYHAEFDFFTGLYNYYREAYPILHPVYKPFAIFFKHGDIIKGMAELKNASLNSLFLRAEATQFLIHIYLEYQSNPNQALYYANQLYEAYPENLYFIAKYVELLLLNNNYDKAWPLIEKLLKQNTNSFSYMKAMIFLGWYKEKHLKNYFSAEMHYKKAILLAEKFGYLAESQIIYVNVGLANIYFLNGNKTQHDFYKKKTKNVPFDYYQKLKVY